MGLRTKGTELMDAPPALRPDDAPEVREAQEAERAARAKYDAATATLQAILNILKPPLVQSDRPKPDTDRITLLKARTARQPAVDARDLAEAELEEAQRKLARATESAKVRVRAERAPHEQDLRRRQYACAVQLAQATEALSSYLQESIALGVEPHAARAVYFGDLIVNPTHESRLDAMRADLASRGIAVD
jgi:hypothetical protein